MAAYVVANVKEGSIKSLRTRPELGYQNTSALFRLDSASSKFSLISTFARTLT